MRPDVERGLGASVNPHYFTRVLSCETWTDKPSIVNGLATQLVVRHARFTIEMCRNAANVTNVAISETVQGVDATAKPCALQKLTQAAQATHQRCANIEHQPFTYEHGLVKSLIRASLGEQYTNALSSTHAGATQVQELFRNGAKNQRNLSGITVSIEAVLLRKYFRSDRTHGSARSLCLKTIRPFHMKHVLVIKTYQLKMLQRSVQADSLFNGRMGALATVQSSDSPNA